ncbi:MAG TPA: hypothetical protein VJ617_00015, partial [Arthrobacter sp.]|nr:hypothetical protein [Arthrobacter sp.]
PRCVLCGSYNATLWTLDNQRRAAVTYLCKSDAAPLVFIMDATENLPPAAQRPLNDRSGPAEEVKVPAQKRGRKVSVLEPLEWVPPTPPPVRQDAS